LVKAKGEEMEYFIVEQDRRLDTAIGGQSFPDRLLKGYEYAEEYEVVIVKSKLEMNYSCIIERPVLLVSDKMRDIFSQFAPEINYKSVVLIDTVRQLQLLYSIMQLKEIPHTVRSDLSRGVQPSDELLLNESLVGDLSIFKMPYFQSSYLIVRIGVAEELLRRNLYGLKLRRIQSIREGDPNGYSSV
jgi:hypothetical protein